MPRCARPTPDARFAYISPTYAQAKDSVWLYLKRFTADIPGVEQRESDLMVVFANGARVRLYGSDNYNRMRGIYLGRLCFRRIRRYGAARVARGHSPGARRPSRLGGIHRHAARP